MAFNYIGAHVGERHKLIEDGMPDDAVSEKEVIRIRAEQSDLIIILLNLAYIPDEVVENIKHFKAGWSKEFLEAITNYYSRDQFSQWNEKKQELIQAEKNKASSEEEAERTSMYALNDLLEEAYLKFVAERETLDKDHDEWVKEYDSAVLADRTKVLDD
jgi:allantoicase